jgi:hypothetical protein
MDIDRKQIAILDFGSQYSHLIARRLRELNIFCELYSCVVSAQELSAQNIIGVVLSGGPASVYDPGDTHSLTHSLMQSLAYAIPPTNSFYLTHAVTHSFTHSHMQTTQYASTLHHLPTYSLNQSHTASSTMITVYHHFIGLFRYFNSSLFVLVYGRVASCAAMCLGVHCCQ